MCRPRISFPPSRAHETELIKKIYGDKPIPEGFILIDEIDQADSGGAVAVASHSQFRLVRLPEWAMEPLVVPDENVRGQISESGPSYRKQLLELFKGILALTRETHIKQLEIPMVGAAWHAAESRHHNPARAECRAAGVPLFSLGLVLPLCSLDTGTILRCGGTGEDASAYGHRSGPAQFGRGAAFDGSPLLRDT